MIAVIFEVWPDPDHQDAYLDLAASLRAELESIDGFISVERFQSLTEEGKLLSVSFFENENSVVAWRNTLAHRRAHAGLGVAVGAAEVQLERVAARRDAAAGDLLPAALVRQAVAFGEPGVGTIRDPRQ